MSIQQPHKCNGCGRGVIICQDGSYVIVPGVEVIYGCPCGGVFEICDSDEIGLCDIITDASILIREDKNGGT